VFNSILSESDLTNAEFSQETISSVATKPRDPYQPRSFHIYECGRCVSFPWSKWNSKGLRLKRHVLASAPTCLRCKWLHSSVWRTNSIMHSWAARASLLLLPEATCSPCYHKDSRNKMCGYNTHHRGQAIPVVSYLKLSRCFYTRAIFNVKMNFWREIRLCVQKEKFKLPKITWAQKKMLQWNPRFHE